MEEAKMKVRVEGIEIPVQPFMGWETKDGRVMVFESLASEETDRFLVVSFDWTGATVIGYDGEILFDCRAALANAAVHIGDERAMESFSGTIEATGIYDGV